MNKKQIANRAWVRSLHASGLSDTAIMVKTQLPARVVYRYLSLTDVEARAQRVAKREASKALREEEQAQKRAQRQADREARRAWRYEHSWQRKQDRLKADGERALLLIANGMKPRDVLLFIGGSRARLYRAMDVARETFDPLLL
jgi:hypothetical protein